MSRFKEILNSHKREDAPSDEPPSPAEEVVHPSPAPAPVQAVDAASRSKPKPRAQASESPRPVGRPRGKRSDDGHVQVTAYIRRDTHLDVKAALLRDSKGRDFSDLVEELMTKWLKSRT